MCSADARGLPAVHRHLKFFFLERRNLYWCLSPAVAYAVEEDGDIPSPQLGVDVAGELAHRTRQQSEDGHIGG
jgi:hypothetical protein